MERSYNIDCRVDYGEIGEVFMWCNDDNEAIEKTKALLKLFGGGWATIHGDEHDFRETVEVQS